MPDDDDNRPMSRGEHIGIILAVFGTVMVCFFVGLVTTVQAVWSWF